MKHNITVLSLVLIGATAAFPQVTLNTAPSRSVGTPLANPESVNPNLVEGKELYSPQSLALDTSVSPPILYVADSANNRVLGWKNALRFTNGQPADLVIGQQDFYATDPQGPGHKFSVGLWFPTGLAVSSTGDLYVVDTDNNRVLRFRTPFQKVSSTPAVLNSAPDLYIGQPGLTSRVANQPAGQPNAQGISLKADYPANITFDGGGNLWLCDVLNYRVLRYPASSLNTTGGNIAADIVIGQQNMTTVATPLTNTATNRQNTSQFGVLGGIGFDPQGRLYVGDSLLARVLVFTNPSAVTSNASADRFMGVFPPNTPAPTPGVQGVTLFDSPQGIFFIPDGSGNAYVGVVDPNLNRATIFPPYSQWPTAPQPPQAVQPGGVIGQNLSFTSFNANQNTSPSVITPAPLASTLATPLAMVFLNSTNELFIADASNNRVIVMPLQPQAGSPVIFGNATRVLGQARFDQFSINYLEGKEFQFTAGAGIALDTNGTVPHLYVADTVNHRVLGFKDARKIAPGLHADIVIGQPDFGTALCNYPSGDLTKPKQTSLCAPYGLAVDPQGALYVADSANGRVLRFPAPFSYTGSLEPADLVLGQQDFTTVVPDPTQSTMRSPYGVAISGTNGLLVSDAALNRVLYFKFSANNTFTAGTDNGKAAAKVFGQQDFFSTTAGNSVTQLNGPHHIAADTSGRLYVADTSNNRILIFHDPNSANTPTGGDVAPLALTSGLTKPLSVYVNPNTGEVWVANTGASPGAVVRYPQYDTLVFNQAPLTTMTDTASDPGLNTLIGFAPLATVQDQFGDLFVADSGNRIITYYQNLTIVNGASFLPNTNRALAPNTIASIFPAKNGSATQFGSTTADFQNQVPVPVTVGDLQVMVNGTASSLFYVSPGQINFVFPWNAPTSGTAQVDVIQTSTGQILGSGLANMSSVSPGIFQCPPSAATLRQGCILNEDGSLNAIGSGAQRGHIVAIYGTGQGPVPNAPPDGTPASGQVPSSIVPRVLLNGLFPEQYQAQPGDPADKSFIKYFGLAPGLLGLWQLNIQIPMGVVPGNNVQLNVNINDVYDTDAGSIDANTGKVFHMSLVVK